MRKRLPLQSLMAFMAFLFISGVSAQTINVFHPNTAPQTGNNRTILPSANVAFPATGAGPSSMTFVINNSGASNLVLSGSSPWIVISGSNAADFSISVPPSSATITAGGSRSFTVTYTPSTTSVETAILTITSNSLTNSSFVINVKGPGKLLYGAQFPPIGSYGFSPSGGMGTAGGTTYAFSAIALAGRTTTYWGPEVSATGDLMLFLSLDGSTYDSQEVLSYSASESNLAGGVVVFRGMTLRNTFNAGNVTTYIKYILTVKKADNVTAFPLTDPTSIGMSEQVGGLVKVNGSAAADNFFANYQMLASPDNATFYPYLDWYNSSTPYQNSCGSCAYISVSSGFYWNDLAPKFTVNNQLSVLEGGTGTILSPAYINLTDDEDLPIAPQRITFSFNSSPPLNFHTGVLKRNGVPLTASSTFTLLDLQSGFITYTHDGSETTYDEFQFSARDSKGVLMNDGNPVNTNFTYRIGITPVNDAPVVRDTSFNVSYAAIPVTKTLAARDADNTQGQLSYTIVTNPTKGNITGFNSATGQYTYTPSFGSPATDNFTFKAYDGDLYSNISTVTFNQLNLPPTVSNSSKVTAEDVAFSGTLTAVDPEGASPITFQLIKPATKGTASIASNGSYTYTPTLSKFGADYFTFKAQDPSGALSVQDTVFVRIIPRLDPGDILVMDQDRVRLYDPLTGQDTIITKGQGLSGGGINLTYRKGTSLFMFDGSTGLIKADPRTGDQSMVAGRAGFSGGGPIGGAAGMLMDNAGRLVLADANNGIVRVDTVTGVITSLFTGGLLKFPTGVAYLDNGDLIVCDAGFMAGGASQIIRITPGGTQTQVSTGGVIKVPLDLAIVDQNTIVVADAGSFGGGSDNIYKVNLSTGAVSVLSTGGNLSIPSGLDFRQNKLYVVNKNGSKKVLDIDITTGAQTVVTGSAISNPWGLMVVPQAVEITHVDKTNETCAGSNNGTATVTFTGAVPPYSYTLDGGPHVTGISSPVTITALTAASHAIIIYDNSSASASTSVVIAAGNPLPDAVATPSSQTICSGTAVTTMVLSGSISGTTFNWTRNNTVSVTGIAGSGSGDISGTLTNTTSAPVTVTFTITPTASGCPGAAITATVLVNPTPNAVATPASQTICSATTISSIVLGGNVSGTTYNWTRDNAVSVTGIAGSGSGDISGTLTNTTAATVTVTFTITPTANGCPGAAITATVLVNPAPVATATPSSQSVCSAAAITTIVLSANIPGTTYTWTRDNTVSVTGIASSGSGDISGTLTNTTANPVTVTFTITPNDGTCNGTPVTASVVVNPLPIMAATPSSQTICSASAINLTITPKYDSPANFETGTLNQNRGLFMDISNSSLVPITVNSIRLLMVPPALGVPTIGQYNVYMTTASGTAAGNYTVPGAWTLLSSPTFLFPAGLGNQAYYADLPLGGSSFALAPGASKGIYIVGVTSIPANFNVAYRTVAYFAPVVTDAAITLTSRNSSSASFTATGADLTYYGQIGYAVDYNYSWTRNNTVNVSGTNSGTTFPVTSVLTNNTNSPQTVDYTVTATSAAGCTTTSLASVLVNPTPNALATPASQTICSGATISSIVLSGNVSGTTYTWTRNNTVSVSGIAGSGSGDISGVLNNTTSAPVTVSFTITPTANGCPGSAITATVLVNPTPNGVATPASQTICSGASITSIVLSSAVSGTSYSWTRDNTVSATGIASSGPGDISGMLTNTTAAPVTVSFTIVSTANGCEGSTITATVTVDPEFTAGSIKTDGETICTNCDPSEIGSQSDASGGDGTISYQWQSSTVSATSGFGDITGATLASYNPPTGLEITTWYRRKAHDGTCSSTFTVSDGIWKTTVSPLFNSGDIETAGETICYGGNPVTIGSVLDATGFGPIHYRWQSSTTPDFASPVDIAHDAPSYQPPAALTVTTWYRRQAHDATTFPDFNTSHGEWKVTIETTPPTAIAKNITRYLDATGNTSIVVADINNGSSDNCSIASLVASKTAFSCADKGDNNVTLTVTDAAGNSATATSVVTVVDAMPPTALAKNITLYLGAVGTASMVAADINNGSSDNCGIASLVASKTAFSCSDKGPNTVILTVTDAAGNSATASSTVTVVDAINPLAVAKNISIFLNAGGSASITAAGINNGSSDNCGIASMIASKTAFSCADKGANTVVLTVTDPSGNSATATSVVTVVDAINPVAIAKNISVTLNPLGTATITAANINNGSYDNCSFTLTANKTSFACADLGTNTVRLTATDASGNTATANSTVTVVEGTALPSPWVSCVLGASNGIGAYTPCTGPGRFTLTSTGYSSPSADVQESVYQTLNGNGSVVAHIYDLSGNGWAGIQIREDCSPGAKKVLIKTQLQTMIRSDIRNTTGGASISTQIMRMSVRWLKLTRTGNRFDAFTSTDGVGWMSAFSTTITMGAAVQIGMISEGINFTSTTQARFDHVVVVSTSAKSVEFVVPNQEAAREINIYPNPATDHVTIEIPEITGKVKCSVYSADGKLLHSEMVEQVTTQLDVSYLKPGVYILRFDSEGDIVTKRLVVY